LPPFPGKLGLRPPAAGQFDYGKYFPFYYGGNFFAKKFGKKTIFFGVVTGVADKQFIKQSTSIFSKKTFF